MVPGGNGMRIFLQLLINHSDANASLMPLKLLSEIRKFISCAARRAMSCFLHLPSIRSHIAVASPLAASVAVSSPIVRRFNVRNGLSLVICRQNWSRSWSRWRSQPTNLSQWLGIAICRAVKEISCRPHCPVAPPSTGCQ